MAIIYNAATNVITATEGTEAIPITSADVYAEDIVQGWGVVTNQGNQYKYACRLAVGDGSTETHFTDKGIDIEFDDTLNSEQTFINVKGNATYTLGEVVDAATNHTTGRVSISFSGSNNDCFAIYKQSQGIVNISHTIIRNNTNRRRIIRGSETDATDLPFTLRNVTLDDIELNRGPMYIYRLTSNSDSLVGNTTWADGIFEDVQIVGPPGRLIVSGPETGYYLAAITSREARQDVWTCLIIRAVPDHSTAFACRSISVDKYVIDGEIDAWQNNNPSIRWSEPFGPNTAKLHEAYTFDPIIQYANGNNITSGTIIIKDNTDTEVVNETITNGRITSQTITRRTYEDAAGDVYATTTTDKNPHTITITDGTDTWEFIEDLDRKLDEIPIILFYTTVGVGGGKPIKVSIKAPQRAIAKDTKAVVGVKGQTSKVGVTTSQSETTPTIDKVKVNVK